MLRQAFPLVHGGRVGVSALAGASDQGGRGINGGVLVLNISGMLHELPSLLRRARFRRFDFQLNEQALLNHHFLRRARSHEDEIPRLPASWNSRAALRCRVSDEREPHRAKSPPQPPETKKSHLLTRGRGKDSRETSSDPGSAIGGVRFGLVIAADAKQSGRDVQQPNCHVNLRSLNKSLLVDPRFSSLAALQQSGKFLEKATPVCADVRIWHLHGMKFSASNCWLDALERRKRKQQQQQQPPDLSRGELLEELGQQCGAQMHQQCDECALVKFAWLGALTRRLLALPAV